MNLTYILQLHYTLRKLSYVGRNRNGNVFFNQFGFPLWLSGRNAKYPRWTPQDKNLAP